SHSASVGSLPPAQPENAFACSQSTQTTGWSSPWKAGGRPAFSHLPVQTQHVPSEVCAGVQAPAATHAPYCLNVTKLLAIEKDFTATRCSGVVSLKYFVPIVKVPPGIATHWTAAFSLF